MTSPTAQRAPGLRLWLDGVELENAGNHVLELEVEERADAASAFRMFLDLSPIDTPDGKGDWDLLERGPFLEGTEGPLLQLMTRVTIGFVVSPDPGEGDPIGATVFDGYVTAMQPRFGEARVQDSRLEVSGLDASCLMHFQTVTKTWSGKSDSEIAAEIFGKYGFSSSPETIEETSPSRALERGAMLQRCTDAEFLRLLARRNGFETYVEAPAGEIEAGPHAREANVGHFHRPRADAAEVQPELRLFPRDRPSLIEFSARWDSHRPTRIRGWRLDELSRLVERADITEPGYPRRGTRPRAAVIGERLGQISFGAGETQAPEGGRDAGSQDAGAATQTPPDRLEASDICSSRTPHHATEMRAMTTARFREADWFVIGEGVVRPERYPAIIRARRPVRLSGAGRLLEGSWYCSVACHRWARDPELDEGQESEQVTRRYEVDVTLLRHALGPDEGADQAQATAAGATT